MRLWPSEIRWLRRHTSSNSLSRWINFFVEMDQLLGTCASLGTLSRLMRHRYALFGLTVWSFSAACSSPQYASSPQNATRSESQILPLVRVRLYASGVGYFERHGNLRAGQSSVPLPAGHLDDALKSLVLLGKDTSSVSFSFPSRLSPAVARARAGLPAADDAAISYDRLLAALRGEEVEVALALSSGWSKSGSATLRGRVVEVVAVEPSHPGYDHGPINRTLPKGEQEAEKPTRLQVVLLTDERAIIRLDLTELASVRPVEPRIAARFEAAMSARTASRSNQSQWLDLMNSGEAVSDVRLAYLAETPTWRASYRLMLAENGIAAVATERQGQLQAWALVHNDTEEAWKGVRLELVDGYPSSFLFPLAAPRYQRRRLETPVEELSSVPQLSTTTPDAMWGDFSDYEGETIETLSAHGGGTGSGQGFGSGHGKLGGSHRASAPRLRSGYASIEAQASDLLWVGDLVTQAGVAATGDRAVSIYRLPQALDLLPQHSAVLPFLSTLVAANPIVWFSGVGAAPERAVGIGNNTTNTLPAGPLAVFRDGGFLGEALLDSMQPGARQFARIGDEPDVDLAASTLESSERRHHVSFRDDSLAVHFIREQRQQWVFNNRTGKVAEIYVGLKVVRNATVTGSGRIDYDSTSGTPFAVFGIGPGSSKSRNITVREALRIGTPVADLLPESLKELSDDDALPMAEREIVRQSMPLLEARLQVVREQAELQLETESLSADLERLRKDAESLSGKESGATSGVVVQRLLDRHDELRALELRQRALEKRLVARTNDVRGALRRLEGFRDAILEERSRQSKATKAD